MATKPHAFRIATDAYSVALAQGSSKTNARWESTAFDDRLPCAQPSRLRIGEFEVNLRTGELRTGVSTVRLQEQPFQILRLLLGHDGEVVTRDEIQEKLWADGTIVDFDHSINAAIKKLRKGFGDSADDPRYVETVARRGYRLMLPVQWPQHVETDPLPAEQVRNDRRSVQDPAHLTEGGIAKRRSLRTFDGGTTGVATSPSGSRPLPHSPQPKAGQQFTATMQHRKLEDRLLFLERLVLARVRGLRRRQRCLFRLQPAAHKT